jgi:hypothetical protein
MGAIHPGGARFLGYQALLSGFRMPNDHRTPAEPMTGSPDLVPNGQIPTADTRTRCAVDFPLSYM